MAILFSTPQTPAVPPPVRMPAPNDQASQDAARQAQQRLMGMPGRQSTDLNGPGSGAGFGGGGGNSYTGTVLGK